MKKKALLATTIALATASAMTFAPVSYKVIDKADAAGPATATQEKKDAVQALQRVYSKLTDNQIIADAYDALLAEASEDVAALEIEADLPNLFDALEANSADTANVQAKLINFLQQVIAHLETGNVLDIKDPKPEFDEALDELNDALIAAGLIENNKVITTDDAAKLLLALEEALLTEKFNPFSNDFTSKLFDAVADFAEGEWSNTNNSIVSVLKNAYASTALLKSDVDSLKAKLNDALDQDENKKLAYKNGAIAFAIAYAQYKLEEKPALKKNYYGKKVPLNPDILGTTFPLSALEWSDNHDNAEITLEDGVLYLTVSGTGTYNVTVTATLAEDAIIPDEFEGIELFSQPITVTYSIGSDEQPVVVPELTLVSDYEQKAEEISGKVKSYLDENPVLNNNTSVRGLQKTIEDQVRQGLTVAAANATTTVNGVTTLTVTPQQLTKIYEEQLDTVLDAAKEAVGTAGVEVNLAPTLTFNVGVTANAAVNLSEAVIDSLESKGIANVGVRTGDVVIEAAVNQLTSSTKIALDKSAASNVEGAKSDVYSVSVTDAKGNDVLGFEKQYRITLPVNGDSSNVTVAMLGEGSQTLVGGQYDPETKTITFYTNVLGDFVVVENKAELNDIDNITWATDAIQQLADKGIIQGKGNGKFDPYANVTRAEFTAMIVRALNLNVDANLTFEDVAEDAWYHDVVAAAYKYGIISGRSEKAFDPNASITREEMATVAANALKKVLGYSAPNNVDEILNAFNDGSNVVSVHRENVAMLANDGIVHGKGNDSYDPKGNANRAEVAVIVASVLNAR